MQREFSSRSRKIENLHTDAAAYNKGTSADTNECLGRRVSEDRDSSHLGVTVPEWQLKRLRVIISQQGDTIYWAEMF